MAWVCLCDRCGKSTRDDAKQAKLIRTKCRWQFIKTDSLVPLRSMMTTMLCGDCVNELEQWMNAKKEVNA